MSLETLVCIMLEKCSKRRYTYFANKKGRINMLHWNTLEFEWDEEKSRLNYLKHGIRFETATHIFEDEDRMEFYDEAHSSEEDRYQTIGMVNKILFVVYTERNDRIRLISAREATPMERRIYHDR